MISRIFFVLLIFQKLCASIIFHKLFFVLGIHLAKKIDKMGMRCSDTAVIYFEDVRVPAKNIIGQEGYGFTYQMLQFQQERLACAALSLMPLERCIADTIGKIIFFKWVDFLKNRQIVKSYFYLVW